MAPINMQRARTESPALRQAHKNPLQESNQSKENTRMENVKIGAVDTKMTSLQPAAVDKLASERPQNRLAATKSRLFSRKAVVVFSSGAIIVLASVLAFKFLPNNFLSVVAVLGFAEEAYVFACSTANQTPLHYKVGAIAIAILAVAVLCKTKIQRAFSRKAVVVLSIGAIMVLASVLAFKFLPNNFLSVAEVIGFAEEAYVFACSTANQTPLHYTFGAIVIAVVAVAVLCKTKIQAALGRCSAKKTA